MWELFLNFFFPKNQLTFPDLTLPITILTYPSLSGLKQSFEISNTFVPATILLILLKYIRIYGPNLVLKKKKIVQSFD